MPTQSLFVSAALVRLRRGVSLCCCILAVALLVQLLAWSIATFLDVRYEQLEDASPQPLIVHAAERQDARSAPTNLLWNLEQPASKSESAAADTQPSVDPNLVPSKYDHLLNVASSIALGAGTMAMVAMLPLLALGVLLGAGSATPGVEQTLSGFMWSIVMAMLVLPVGAALGMPWQEGALCSYGHMTQEVEMHLAGEPASMGAVTFYARFLLLPMACIIGAAFIGLRFAAGVEAGIIPKEDMRLDPVLEKEAANIKATSLHGSRTASALRNIAGPSAAGAAGPAAAVGGPAVGAAKPIGQLSAGEPLRRLI